MGASESEVPGAKYLPPSSNMVRLAQAGLDAMYAMAHELKTYRVVRHDKVLFEAVCHQCGLAAQVELHELEDARMVYVLVLPPGRCHMAPPVGER